MGSIKYYLNKGVGTEKNRPIMISYHFNGQRIFYYTGLRIAETEFNQYGKFPAKPECIDRVYINNRLLLIRNFIGEIENEALAGGKILTPDLLRMELNKRLKPKPEPAPAPHITLKQYFDIYIEAIPKRTHEITGRKLSKAMPVKYNAIKKLFNDFCEAEGRDYDFQDIDKLFFERFSAYMMNEKKYAVNTYGRAIKFLKTVLNKAKEDGFNNSTAYQSALKTNAHEDSDSIYLNEAELNLFRDLDLSTRPGLDRVRDLFLIGCETGLRFSDYTSISPDDINVKQKRLRVLAQKTNQKVVIPLSPEVLKLFKKYNYDLPKAISNQKFNLALKDIAELAGLNEVVVTNITKGGETITNSQPKFKLVTSHVARRSFATNQIKKGLEPMLIMAITGHKTEKEFLKYIKLTPEEKADLFEKRNKW